MRPERLELDGFGVFREPTVIDFAGADLFALTGPTGAGKSTVIDAIVFALYGSVPRYDNKTLVAPVISQGRVEARVRLDLAVGDDRYRIVRVVRAAARGATTKEARLERVGDGDALDVLAGTADEVTAAVEQLLGLSYDHFTTCVVLPQGAFQRFLHHKPAGRQDLLVELLDLGVYGRMATTARARAVAAGHQRSYVADELRELAGYQPDQRSQLEHEIEELGKLLTVIDDAEPAIDRLAAEAETAGAEARDLTARATALASLAVPADVRDLARARQDALAAVDQARTAEDEARARRAQADAALDDLPARSALDAAAREHEARSKEAARIPRGEHKVAEALAAAESAAAGLATAQAERTAAAEALDEARRHDRARELAAHLVVGDPCPVCLQPVEREPDHAPTNLARLVAAERSAAQALAQAEEAHRAAASDCARFQELLDDVRHRVAEADERLAGLAELAEVTAGLTRLDEAENAARTARRAEDAATRERVAAERRVESLRADEQRAWRRFDQARDAVAALGPPVPAREDIAADWYALVGWAETERPIAARAAEQAVAAATRAADEAARRRAELADACDAAGVVVPAGRQPRDVVVDHLANVRADLESLEGILARVDQLRATEARLAEQEQVAAALGQHLRSTGFEKWVLDEVLQRLVAGATEILFDLSGGAYSLTFDSRANFSVIDHANADAVRSARTLSGGETFLASLALALALADEVAQLAASGTVRLESIFLDEGFGTLDADVLDTVASAIEELGARGRLVGLVTHVRDLAERLPVRFEVTRAGNASSVARVER
jgi:exonuclease SbcC